MVGKYRTNKEILAPLRLSSIDADALARAIQARVKQAREKNQDKMAHEAWVRNLSEQWLQGNGQSYFIPGESRLLWPRDNAALIGMVAELMCAQNVRMEEKNGSHKRVHVLQELKGLQMWPEKQSKKLCTRSDVEQRFYDEVMTDSATSSNTGSPFVDSNSPEPNRTSYIVRLGTNRDVSGGCAEPNPTARKHHDAVIEHNPIYPSHHERAHAQPTQVASYGYRTPMATPILTSPFEPRTTVQHSENPSATPPQSAFDEDDQRSISEHTEETVEDQTFKVDCNGKEYETTGQKCANVLQLTLLLLEQMKAELRVVSLQRKTIDSQAKVAHILKQIEEELNK